jgi:NADH:ubiquinone oxidoreductase subunit D
MPNQIWPKINKFVFIKIIIKIKIINLFKRLTIRLKIMRQIIKIKIKIFKWLTKKNVKTNQIRVNQNTNSKKIANNNLPNCIALIKK